MKTKLYTAGIACTLAMISSANVSAVSCAGDPVGYCLSSGNAIFDIDDLGAMSMLVDDIKHVWTTDFLIANTATTVAVKGNDLTAAHLSFFDYMDLTQPQTSTSTVDLTGMSIGTWGSVDLNFELIGGDAGSNYAEIIQTFTITNTTATAQDISMIAFTDVDLGGQFGSQMDDEGALVSFESPGKPNAFLQFDSTYQMLASVGAGQAPTHYEVGVAQDCVDGQGDVCSRVYNELGGTGTHMTLGDTVDPGPNDIQMAAQWLAVLGSGETYTYTQSMVLSNLGYIPPSQVPVPAAVWLFGSGLLGLVGIARRRKV